MAFRMILLCLLCFYTIFLSSVDSLFTISLHPFYITKGDTIIRIPGTITHDDNYNDKLGKGDSVSLTIDPPLSIDSLVTIALSRDDDNGTLMATSLIDLPRNIGTIYAILDWISYHNINNDNNYIILVTIDCGKQPIPIPAISSSSSSSSSYPDSQLRHNPYQFRLIYTVSSIQSNLSTNTVLSIHDPFSSHVKLNAICNGYPRNKHKITYNIYIQDVNTDIDELYINVYGALELANPITTTTTATPPSTTITTTTTATTTTSSSSSSASSSSSSSSSSSQLDLPFIEIDPTNTLHCMVNNNNIDVTITKSKYNGLYYYRFIYKFVSQHDYAIICLNDNNNSDLINKYSEQIWSYIDLVGIQYNYNRGISSSSSSSYVITTNNDKFDILYDIYSPQIHSIAGAISNSRQPYLYHTFILTSNPSTQSKPHIARGFIQYHGDITVTEIDVLIGKSGEKIQPGIITVKPQGDPPIFYFSDFTHLLALYGTRLYIIAKIDPGSSIELWHNNNNNSLDDTILSSVQVRFELTYLTIPPSTSSIMQYNYDNDLIDHHHLNTPDTPDTPDTPNNNNNNTTHYDHVSDNTSIVPLSVVQPSSSPLSFEPVLLTTISMANVYIAPPLVHNTIIRTKRYVESTFSFTFHRILVSDQQKSVTLSLSLVDPSIGIVKNDSKLECKWGDYKLEPLPFIYHPQYHYLETWTWDTIPSDIIHTASQQDTVFECNLLYLWFGPDPGNIIFTLTDTSTTADGATRRNSVIQVGNIIVMDPEPRLYLIIIISIVVISLIFIAIIVLCTFRRYKRSLVQRERQPIANSVSSSLETSPYDAYSEHLIADLTSDRFI